MEYLLGIILWVPFLFWNYKIVQTDIKEKRIPNRYLLFLLCIIPFWYVYGWYFGYFSEVHLWVFILQIIVTIVVWFIIYSFWKWWAGDAKYLIVLALFIPHIGIISFIFSIAVITIVYLLWYFLWFWFGPNLWNTQRRKDLYKSLWKMKKDQFSTKNKYKRKKDIFIALLVYTNIFLVFFIIIRLIRFEIIAFLEAKYNTSIWEILMNQIYNQTIWIIIIAWSLVIWIILIRRHVIPYYKSKISPKVNWYIIVCISICLIIFLLYEYYKSRDEIVSKMLLILTIYLWITIMVKALLFAYKITFVTKEEYIIDIKYLKEWMLVNKKFLMNNWVKNVFFESKNIKPEEIDTTNVAYLKKIYRDFNKFHAEQKTKDFMPHKFIKINNVISFGIYIYVGFLQVIIWSTYGSQLLESLVDTYL